MSDLQAGYEKTQSYMLAMLAGANIIYGSGMLELGMSFSLGQLVADNEMVRMLRRLLKGVPVNKDTLALEVIKKVGQRGHYLQEDHTVTNMRAVHVAPKLIDREARSVWVEEGSVTFAEKANKKAVEIIESHKPTPLPADVAAKLRSFVEAVEKEFGVTN